VTGVPAAQSRSLAREYATTKHACIATGNGFEHATSCNDALRAIAILSAVCGHLDRPGGDLLAAAAVVAAATTAGTASARAAGNATRCAL